MVFSHCLLCRLLGHNRPEETLLMIFYLFAVIYCARRLQQQQQRWRPYLWWLYSLLIRELVTSLYINPLQCEHISVLRHSFNYLIPCRSSSMIGGIIIRLGMHIVDLSLSVSGILIFWYYRLTTYRFAYKLGTRAVFIHMQNSAQCWLSLNSVWIQKSKWLSVPHHPLFKSKFRSFTLSLSSGSTGCSRLVWSHIKRHTKRFFNAFGCGLFFYSHFYSKDLWRNLCNLCLDSAELDKVLRWFYIMPQSMCGIPWGVCDLWFVGLLMQLLLQAKPIFLFGTSRKSKQTNMNAVSRRYS